MMVVIGMPKRWSQPVPLEITQRAMDGIHVLVLRGRLALGDESNGLRSAIDQLLAAGSMRIVLNLEHLNYVDSAGLGALIETQRKTKATGGQLKLCHIGPKLKQALEIAQLLPLFESYPTETAALASF
jgi:anti-sigma B factor antagonist